MHTARHARLAARTGIAQMRYGFVKAGWACPIKYKLRGVVW
jgi:hypothetical protein